MLLRVKGFYQPKAGWKGFLVKLIVAVAAMGGVLWMLLHAQTFYVFDWYQSGHMRALQLMVLVSIGALVYFLALGLMGFRPRHFKRSVV